MQYDISKSCPTNRFSVKIIGASKMVRNGVKEQGVGSVVLTEGEEIDNPITLFSFSRFLLQLYLIADDKVL